MNGKEISVIGAGVVDVLVGAVDEKILTRNSTPMDFITLSFGGDALNESIVLSRLGKRVQWISKVGDDDAGKNISALMERGLKCAVVKRGGKGCLLAQGGELIEIPACPVEKVIDTTGAGDCFAAGFLFALSEGWSLENCGRFACAAASCSVEQVGAVAGVTSLEKVMTRYSIT